MAILTGGGEPFDDVSNQVVGLCDSRCKWRLCSKMYLERSSSTTTRPKGSLVSGFYGLPDIEDNELEVYAR
ncbi:hypothetical protein ANTPLA_LOCUS3615 [Anthophora plagiata]